MSVHPLLNPGQLPLPCLTPQPPPQLYSSLLSFPLQPASQDMPCGYSYSTSKQLGSCQPPSNRCQVVTLWTALSWTCLHHSVAPVLTVSAQETTLLSVQLVHKVQRTHRAQAPPVYTNLSLLLHRMAACLGGATCQVFLQLLHSFHTFLPPSRDSACTMRA